MVSILFMSPRTKFNPGRQLPSSDMVWALLQTNTDEPWSDQPSIYLIFFTVNILIVPTLRLQSATCRIIDCNGESQPLFNNIIIACPDKNGTYVNTNIRIMNFIDNRKISYWYQYLYVKLKTDVSILYAPFLPGVLLSEFIVSFP